MPKPKEKKNIGELLNSGNIIAEKLTPIRQPNRVTMASHNYTQTQNRILLRIIESLQGEMALLDKGYVIGQLPLFTSTNDSSVTICLPFKKMCANKRYYNEVKDALEDLRKVSVKMEMTDLQTGAVYVKGTGIIEKYLIPSKYSRDAYIQVDKSVARELINLNKGFTRFSLEIAFNTNNRYTSRIYQMICRWKDKEMYVMPVEKFKEWLCLDGKYSRFDNLMERIIKPAYKELLETADIYFEYSLRKSGHTVTHICFIPKIRETVEEEERFLALKRENFCSMLRQHFGLKDKHFQKLAPLLQRVHPNDLLMRLTQLIEYLDSLDPREKSSTVRSLPDYTVQTFLNAFPQ